MPRVFLCVTLLLCTFSAKAGELLPPELPPEKEEISLRLAETTGLAIHRHDRAASVVTDALLKKRAFKSDRRVRGWITVDHGNSIEVLFVGGEVGSPSMALYHATVSESGELIGEATALSEPKILSGFELAAAEALAIARASDFTPCSSKYNTVVLPVSEGDHRWAIYLIPATTRHDIVPVGGAHRVEVNLETKETFTRAYTRSCIELQKDPRAVALMVTHMLDAVPTEMHVFWSLWAEMPLVVATPPNGTIWLVAGAQIKLMERKPTSN